jgi:hypothetical protein
MAVIEEYWYNTNFHTTTKSISYKILYDFSPPIYIPYFPKDYPLEAVDHYLNKIKGRICYI